MYIEIPTLIDNLNLEPGDGRTIVLPGSQVGVCKIVGFTFSGEGAEHLLITEINVRGGFNLIPSDHGVYADDLDVYKGNGSIRILDICGMSGCHDLIFTAKNTGGGTCALQVRAVARYEVIGATDDASEYGESSTRWSSWCARPSTAG